MAACLEPVAGAPQRLAVAVRLNKRTLRLMLHSVHAAGRGATRVECTAQADVAEPGHVKVRCGWLHPAAAAR